MVQRCPTDLTDTACTLFAPLIPGAKLGGRPRTTDMREVVNAIFYGSDIHVMLALRGSPGQVIVTNKQHNGADMVDELL